MAIILQLTTIVCKQKTTEKPMIPFNISCRKFNPFFPENWSGFVVGKIGASVSVIFLAGKIPCRK